MSDLPANGSVRARSRDVILDVEGLSFAYKVRRGSFFAKESRSAISDISLRIGVGESLGVVGESGSGKTTMLRAIVQIVRPSSGRVLLGDRDLAALDGDELRAARRGIGFIFQDPFASLNPMWPVWRLIAEPMLVEGTHTRAEIDAKVTELMSVVGLNAQRDASRRPREFSGGQVQRIAIARALASEPQLLVCDEAVSALDVSIQAQILNLFEDLKAERQLSLLFVSHDLSVVEYISDRVAVIFGGRLCEIATTADIYAGALHPYTEALIAASPHRRDSAPATVSEAMMGEPPSQDEHGCRYRDRCPLAEERCATETPELREVRPAHFVACHVR